MDERKLPAPATSTDEYLYDIALSLRVICGLLLVQQQSAAQQQQPTDGEVVLKEPEPPKRKHRG